MIYSVQTVTLSAIGYMKENEQSRGLHAKTEKEMSLKSEFKNFAHAVASGAKWFADSLVPDAVKVAAKAQALEPEADALLTALAGPQAAAVGDLAFHAFGAIAEKLKPLSGDALAAVSANGINLVLDTQVVNDIKSYSELIEKLLASRGTPAPPAKA